MSKAVTIRVPDDEFERMDEKRHRERTSLQEVGLAGLRGWLSLPPSAGSTRPDINSCNREEPGVIFRTSGSEDPEIAKVFGQLQLIQRVPHLWEHIKGNIEAFAENAAARLGGVQGGGKVSGDAAGERAGRPGEVESSDSLADRVRELGKRTQDHIGQSPLREKKGRGGKKRTG